MNLIDTHAHLNDARLLPDIDEVVLRAKDAGVGQIITCGYDLESSEIALKLATDYEYIYASAGIHPHDAKSYSNEIESSIEKLCNNTKVVAVGEIGLDFHYNFSPREAQINAFEAQLELASKIRKPVIIHSRESNEEVFEIIKKYKNKVTEMIFHCFSGDVEFAKKVLDLGCYIGIDGPVTFKSSEELREVVRYVPIEKILLETDCPYLTPIPFRGKRNEPSYLTYIAEFCAQIKHYDKEDFADITTNNAKELFKIS